MSVCFIVPGDIDDPAAVSGGNLYDRRISQELRALGVPVRDVPVPGQWPRPTAAARTALASVLAGCPDGSAVLIDGLVACGVPDVLVPHAGRLRLVVLVHLPLADETGLPPEVAEALDAVERRALGAASAVVATSDWAAGRLVDHHGLPPDRVHAVAPGTDPAPRSPGPHGASRLLCVASVTPRKGHDLLVDALAAVADLPWTCECVGPLGRDPAQVALVRARIAHHGLGDRISLVGPRSGARLAAAYATADLLVLASRAETYGMVVTEALAHGVPVLATACGGISEALGRVAGGLPGLLVPPGDQRALTEALRDWLLDADLRRTLRTAAGQRGDELPTWTEAAKSMADVLAVSR
ncbi:glycosyltransferase family 4 protein [Actinokineospora sp. 24-640]